jgi:hypothetical protein
MAYQDPQDPQSDGITQPIAPVRVSAGTKLAAGGFDSKGRPMLTQVADGSVDFKAIGEGVKQLHPEYSDMDSQTLGQNLMKKYPEYGKMIAAGKPIPASVHQDPKLAADPVHMALASVPRPVGAVPQYAGDSPSTPSALSAVGRAGVAGAANVAGQLQGLGGVAKDVGKSIMGASDTPTQAAIRGAVTPDPAYDQPPGFLSGGADTPVQAGIRSVAKAVNPMNLIPTDRFKAGDIAGGVGELGSNVMEMLALHRAGAAGKAKLPAVASPEMTQAAKIVENVVKPLPGEGVATPDIAKALESVRKFSGPDNMPTSPAVLASRMRAAANKVKGPRSATLNKVADVIERSVSEKEGPLPTIPGMHGMNMASHMARVVPRLVENSHIATAGRLASGTGASPLMNMMRQALLTSGPVSASQPGQQPGMTPPGQPNMMPPQQ